MSTKSKSALSLIARQFHILIIAIFLIGLLPLPAMAADGTVSGQVTDNSTSNPIQNADVLFYESGAPDYFSIASTDNVGQYTDFIAEGTDYEIEVTKTGYFTQRLTGVTITASPDNVFNFSLVPGGAFIGEITDSVEGFLIEDALVSIYKPETPGTTYNATTDDLGYYSITVPPDTGYTIAVSCNGYLSANVTGQNAVLGTPTTVNIPIQQADSTPQADITDLVAGGATPNSVNLTWTALGDDGVNGTASHYELRLATYIINNQSTWDSAQSVPNMINPAMGSDTENFMVTGFTANTTYFFAIKTVDDVGLWSGISNSPSATTPLPPTFTITYSQSKVSFMLAAGANITETYHITSINNFEGTVNLNFGGPPVISNYTSVTPNQVTLTAGQTQSVSLNISVGSMMPSGSYQCGLDGQTSAYGGQQKGAFFTIIVGVPGQPLLSASPSVISAGGQTSIFASQFPATANITLKWDSGPSAGDTLATGQTDTNGNWNVPMDIPAEMPGGNFILEATSGQAVAACQITVTSGAGADFLLSTSPQFVSIVPGESANITIYVSSINQFDGTVTLTTGSVPDVTMSLASSSVTPAAGDIRVQSNAGGVNRLFNSSGRPLVVPIWKIYPPKGIQN